MKKIYFILLTICLMGTACKENEPTEKPTTEKCNISNPLTDLPWLNEIVTEFEKEAEILGYNPLARIYQCRYKTDSIGFLLEMCVECLDAEYSFRNCEGVILCGGDSGKNDCSTFGIKNKKLIWEMKSNQIEPQKPCLCIMDTLKGEWIWIKKYDGVLENTTDNDFKSVVKILGQNQDASINYEVFVEDTLFYKGAFQILYNQDEPEYRGTAIMTLPYLPSWNGGQLIKEPHQWYIYFGDPRTRIKSSDIMCFARGVRGYYEDDKYYYQKIK